MNRRVAASIGAAVAGGVLVATAVPALAAVTNSSPPERMYIKVVSPGTVIKHGQAVRLTFVVSCPADAFLTSVQVTVSERTGGAIASGWAGPAVNCTGRKQTVTTDMQTNSKSFVAGSASIDAQLWCLTGQSGNSILVAAGTTDFVN
jgi:hypothetical protein